MNIDFQEILKELEFRVPKGIIDLNQESQVTTLVQILRENGVSDANEYAQRARVVFSYVNEASKKKLAAKPKKKPAAKPKKKRTSNAKDYPYGDEKITYKNDAGEDREILVRTALGYKDAKSRGQKQAYQAALQYIKDKQKGGTKSKKPSPDKTNTITISGAEERQTEKQNVSDDKQKIEKAFNSTYKKTKPGQVMGDKNEDDNQVKNDLLEYGFDNYQAKTGKKPAPGSKGSAFNEIISGEGTRILENSPDLSDIELTRVIMKQFCGTALGKSQSESKDINKYLPNDLKGNSCAQKSYIAAKSARDKFDRADKTKKELQSKGILSKNTKIHTFYGSDSRNPDGTMQDGSSKSAQIKMAKEAKRIMAPDGTIIDRDDAVAFIAAGGGGANPSDTGVFLKDDKGNLVIKFYSDKTSTADIQDNSTLAQEIADKSSQIDSLEKSGVLSKTQAKKAREIVMEYAKNIAKIEETYSEGNKLVAANMIKGGDGYGDTEQVNLMFGKGNEKWREKNNIEKNFKIAVSDKKGNIKKEIIENLPEDCDKNKPSNQCLFFGLRNLVATGKSTGDQQKVIMKLSAGLVDKFSKEGKEIPAEIDVNSIVSVQRKKVADLYHKMYDKQNETTIKVGNTKKGLGTLLQAEDVIDSFHLHLMDYPPKKYKKGDPESLMGSCFEASMGGDIVNGEILRGCLGVKNTQEFKERFDVKKTQEYTYEFTEDEAVERLKNKGIQKPNKKQLEKERNVTGLKFLSYMVDKKTGEQQEIGFRTYRGKSGKTSKTSNTMQYSANLQKCFAEKNK